MRYYQFYQVLWKSSGLLYFRKRVDLEVLHLNFQKSYNFQPPELLLKVDGPLGIIHLLCKQNFPKNQHFLPHSCVY